MKPALERENLRDDVVERVWRSRKRNIFDASFVISFSLSLSFLSKYGLISDRRRDLEKKAIFSVR